MSERGQAVVEYVLIVGLISLPLSMLILYTLKSIFFAALTKIVQGFASY